MTVHTFHHRPGECLGVQSYVAHFSTNDWRLSDFKIGAPRAIELGWLEDTKNGLRLTEAGYAAAIKEKAA